MAIYTALFDVGILIGGPLLGLVIELSGYGAMYSAAAMIVLAGAVSFARGLNDTPKIVGLVFVIDALDNQVSLLLVAAVMVLAMGISRRQGQ